MDQDNRNQFVCPTVTLRRAEDKEIICEEVHARLPTFRSRKRYFCRCSQCNLRCLGKPATFQFLPLCALIQEHLNSRERHLSMEKGASSGAGCERQPRRHGNLCIPESGHIHGSYIQQLNETEPCSWLGLPWAMDCTAASCSGGAVLCKISCSCCTCALSLLCHSPGHAQPCHTRAVALTVPLRDWAGVLEHPAMARNRSCCPALRGRAVHEGG